MLMYLLFFFFNDTATTEIYTLSLHDALPIVFPVMSAERGAEATHIFQGSLLLVSGVYYPIEVLPGWMQPLSAISPATYTLSACRKLFGVGNSASTPE